MAGCSKNLYPANSFLQRFCFNKLAFYSRIFIAKFPVNHEYCYKNMYTLVNIVRIYNTNHSAYSIGKLHNSHNIEKLSGTAPHTANSKNHVIASVSPLVNKRYNTNLVDNGGFTSVKYAKPNLRHATNQFFAIAPGNCNGIGPNQPVKRLGANTARTNAKTSVSKRNTTDGTAGKDLTENLEFEFVVKITKQF